MGRIQNYLYSTACGSLHAVRKKPQTQGRNMSQQIGFAAETFGCDYLLAQGLRLVRSNYRSRLGEIDLIMRDGDYLVFVEVRARCSNLFGGPLASVTASKQKKIIKTALCYLSATKSHDKPPVRFDVLGIEGTPSRVTWIKNAFGVD